jgi:cytochrome c biogenesis protein CcmG, thiol:disulfide interchange protein DsbE
MTRQLKLGAQALAVTAVAALLALLIWKIAHQPSVPKGSAPDFTLPRLDRNGEMRLAALRGKAVVLNFWASWCVPCKEEAPLLQAAAKRWNGRGVVVVGIDSQDFKGDARRFARRYGVTYPIVHDGPGKTRDSYGVTGFPETFFVDREGKLVGDHVQGPVTAQKLNDNIRRAVAT